jgi:hypothetical protein
MLFQNILRKGPFAPSVVSIDACASDRFCSWFMPRLCPISWTTLPTCLLELHQPRLMRLVPRLPG